MPIAYWSVLITFVLASSVKAENLSLGNSKEVIQDVSKAIKDSAKDSELKQSASDVEKMSQEDPNCAPGDIADSSKSEILIEKNKIKKSQLFFDLQLMVVGKNGEPAFTELEVPRINLRDELTFLQEKTGKTRKDLLSMSDDKLRKLLMENTNTLSGEIKNDAIDNSLLINRLSQYKSQNEMFQALKDEMKNASYAKKVNFLANFLSYLSDNYDDALASGVPGTKKVVTDKQLMTSINQSISSGEPVPAGVCRHMHQLAVRYAQTMGLTETFGVGYTTMIGSHRTLVITSPDDPTRVFQLNYGSKVSLNGVSGPEALNQSHKIPDTGIRFRIFNGKDEHAINLPTEQGAILNRVTGGKDSDLSPNFKSKAQIQQVGVGTPYGTFRLFFAETPLGGAMKTGGGSYNLRLDFNKVFYGDYGVAGFASEKPSLAGTVKNHGLYGKATHGFDLKIYESDDLSLSTFGEATVRASVFCPTINDGVCENAAEAQFDIYSGVMAVYKLGSTKNKTSLLLQSQLEDNSATNHHGLILSMPVFKISHDTDFKITSNVDGNLGGSVTNYNLGTGSYSVFNAHTSVDFKRTGTFFEVNADGRISKNTPFWLPGAEQQGSVILKQSIFDDKVYIGVDGRQSFDIYDNRYFGILLGGFL